MDDRVIHDIMNDVLLPHGRYPENFALISRLEVCQEWGLRRLVGIELRRLSLWLIFE